MLTGGRSRVVATGRHSSRVAGTKSCRWDCASAPRPLGDGVPARDDASTRAGPTMAVIARPFPPALPHGELDEVLPGLFLVTGTARLPGPLPVRFSRNMTVVREGERLVLLNSVRLDEAGLAK